LGSNNVSRNEKIYSTLHHQISRNEKKD
jgi:hypothetical protein